MDHVSQACDVPPSSYMQTQQTGACVWVGAAPETDNEPQQPVLKSLE